jgi:hypothetical protein
MTTVFDKMLLEELISPSCAKAAQYFIEDSEGVPPYGLMSMEHDAACTAMVKRCGHDDFKVFIQTAANADSPEFTSKSKAVLAGRARKIKHCLSVLATHYKIGHVEDPRAILRRQVSQTST